MAELRSVNPTTLLPNPDNPRRTPAPKAQDEQLAASIRAVGIIQPPRVPAGATKPPQATASNPGLRVSATVGVSGARGSRRAVVTASSRARPACACGRALAAVSNITGTTPPTKSAIAGPPLRQRGQRVHATEERRPHVDGLAHAPRAAVLQHPHLGDDAAHRVRHDVELPVAQGRLPTCPRVEAPRRLVVALPPVVGERKEGLAVAEAEGTQMHEQVFVGVDGPERPEHADPLDQARRPEPGSHPRRVEVEAAKVAEQVAVTPGDFSARIHELGTQDARDDDHGPLRLCRRALRD